ncbi:MAG: hypothetical protein WD401_01455, partial [Thermomicrobiaceae bacterium]
PLVLDSVTFNEASRLISVNASRDVPEDTVCTADWTPRVFVVAMDRDHLGDGELRAEIGSSERGENPESDGGTVIRED